MSNDISDFANFIKKNRETKFFEDSNLPQTDLESKFHNYKVTKLTFFTNYPPSLIRCDDNMDFNLPQLMNLDKDIDKVDIKIVIEPLLIQGKKFSIPIATFTTL